MRVAFRSQHPLYLTIFSIDSISIPYILLTVSDDGFIKSETCSTIWTMEILSDNIFVIDNPPVGLFTHHNGMPPTKSLNFRLGSAN